MRHRATSAKDLVLYFHFELVLSETGALCGLENSFTCKSKTVFALQVHTKQTPGKSKMTNTCELSITIVVKAVF